VTRTLAKLLEHIEVEGHEAIVLGPATSVVSFRCKRSGLTMTNDALG